MARAEKPNVPLPLATVNKYRISSLQVQNPICPSIQAPSVARPPGSITPSIHSARTLHQLQSLLEQHQQQLTTLAQLSGAFAAAVKLAAPATPGTAGQDPRPCLSIIWQQLQAGRLLNQVPGAALAVLLWTCGQDPFSLFSHAAAGKGAAGGSSTAQQPSPSSLAAFLQHLPQQLLCPGLFSKTLVSLSAKQELQALASPQRMQQLLTVLLDPQLSQNKAAHPQELASSLAAAVTLRLPVPTQQQQAALVGAFVQQLGSASTQDISMVLWGLASCGAKRLNPEDLEQLLDAFCGLASSARPTQISNVLWSLGTMGAHMNPDQQQLLLSSLLTSRSSKAQHLSTGLWALATLQVAVLPEQLHQLLAALSARLSHASCKDVINALWAAGSLGASIPREQLQGLLGFLSPRLEQLQQQELEQVLWAAAALGQPLSEQQLRGMRDLRGNKTLPVAEPVAVTAAAAVELSGAGLDTPGSGRSSNSKGGTGGAHLESIKAKSGMMAKPRMVEAGSGRGGVQQQQQQPDEQQQQPDEQQQQPAKPVTQLQPCASTSATGAASAPAAVTAAVAAAYPQPPKVAAPAEGCKAPSTEYRNSSPDGEVIARVQEKRGRKRGGTRWGRPITPDEGIEQQGGPVHQHKLEQVEPEKQQQKKLRLSNGSQKQHNQQNSAMQHQLETAGSCDMEIDSMSDMPQADGPSAAAANNTLRGSWVEVRTQPAELAMQGQQGAQLQQPCKSQQRQQPSKHQRIEFRLESRTAMDGLAEQQQQQGQGQLFQDKPQQPDRDLVKLTLEREQQQHQKQQPENEDKPQEERVPLGRPERRYRGRGGGSRSSSSGSGEEREEWPKGDRGEEGAESGEQWSDRDQRKWSRGCKGVHSRQQEEHRRQGLSRQAGRRRDWDGGEEEDLQKSGRDKRGTGKRNDRNNVQDDDLPVSMGGGGVVSYRGESTCGANCGC